MTHSYLTRGFINAKRVAPWYALALESNDNEELMLSEEEEESEKVGATDESDIVKGLGVLNIFDEDNRLKTMFDKESPRMKYLLDSSLNKLCRWLRILGQNVALETDEEEKLRTGKGDMIIFDRCRTERRTLVTTSPRLMQRKDCPPSVYCIHPPFLPKLEVALVHMLLTHGVVLEPSTFLSRCVVCNGNIVEVEDEAEKRRILIEYEAPPDLIDDGMAVYECDGCRQGYWWNERPTSSASRVKTAATRLLELCVRGGVPVREGDDLGLFQKVNVEELRRQGWDSETPGSDLLQQRLDVIDWLKQEHLKCPFALQSAYAHRILRSDNANADGVNGENIPFTNVTHQFVDTLDYIFFDKMRMKATERLYVPSSFRELGDGRTYIDNAHLLPSDVWPSDHLAIGARLSFLADEETTVDSKVVPTAMSSLTFTAVVVKDDECGKKFAAPMDNDDAQPLDPDLDIKHASERVRHFVKCDTPSAESDSTGVPLQFCAPTGGAGISNSIPLPPLRQVHGQRCGCGCVPAMPSLFEMAERRKQAKLKASSLNGQT